MSELPFESVESIIIPSVEFLYQRGEDDGPLYSRLNKDNQGAMICWGEPLEIKVEFLVPIYAQWETIPPVTEPDEKGWRKVEFWYKLIEDDKSA